MASTARRYPLKAVKLSEIPFEKRMSAARIEARYAIDEEEAADIFMSAMFPSEKVYWVRDDERAAA
jgi:hypothetical protein